MSRTSVAQNSLNSSTPNFGRWLSVVAVLLFFAGFVFAQTPSPIDSCREITSSGSYILTENLSGTYGCLFINANNVILDCDGHSITGGATSSAITLGTNPWHSAWYVTIKNCIISNSWEGIYLGQYSSSATIINNTISATNLGVYLQFNSNNNIFTNNTITVSDMYGVGVYLYSSSYNTFANNTISSTGQYGSGAVILTSPSNNFTNNNFSVNQDSTGFYIYGGSIEDFQNSIDETNTINGLPIEYYDGVSRTCPNNQALDLGSDYSMIGLVGCDNVSVTADPSNTLHLILLAFTNNSIINGTSSNSAFLYSSSYNNFTYNNIASNGYDYGLDLESGSNNNIFAFNNMTGYNGAYLVSSSNNSFISNNVTSVDYEAVYLGGSSYNNFTNNNIFSQNYYGAALYGGSDYNTFTNNTISSTNESGAFLSSSSNNTFTSNSITSTNNIGAYFWSSSNNIFTNNTISSTNSYGARLDSSSNNIFTNNNISSMYDMGVWLVSSSTYNTFTNNSISTMSDYRDGIYLESGSDYNVFISNNISSAGEYGAYISTSNNNFTSNKIIGYSYGVWLASAYYNIFTNNNITSMNNYGVRLDSSSDNVFYNNIFNGSESVYTTGEQNYWNATLISGTNILGGNLIGGNAYFKLDGTGFSETCNDNDQDGICDDVYDILGDGSNVDYLPLTYPPAAPPALDCGILDQPNTVYTLTQDVSSDGTCFTIAANNVTLDCNGSTITYAQTTNNSYGIYVNGYNFTTIKNCNIVQMNSSVSNAHAIYLYSARNSTIQNNNISVNGSYSRGMYLNSSSYNIFTNNAISSNNGSGSYLSSSSNNNFTNNTISSTNYFGVYLYSSSNNTFANNNITSTNGNSTYLFYSSNNNFTNNTISSTNYFGAYLDSSSNNNFINNTISSMYRAGAVLFSSFYNTFANNSITSTNRNSTVLSGSNYNTFTNNRITAYDRGAYLVSSSNNTFINNNITSTNGHGAYLSSSSDNVFYSNIFNGSIDPVYISYGQNYWNTTLTSGTNILGGNLIGGNAYFKLDGTGFSETCDDNDQDGICDDIYDILGDGSNVDYYPLKFVAAQPPSDTIPPFIQLLSPSNATWHKLLPLTFTFNATDDQSTTMNCSLYIDDIHSATNSSVLNSTQTSFTLSSMTNAAHTWKINCSDQAGNSNVSDTFDIYFDNQPPDITFSLSSTIVYVGDSITAECNATDNSESYGIPGVTVSKSIMGIDTTSAGIKTATCTAIDMAGNTETKQILYTVLSTPLPPSPPGGCIPLWQCSEWSDCSVNGTKTRTCVDLNNCGTTQDKPTEITPCVYLCTPNWQCTQWSECSPDGIQTRTCQDFNNCSLPSPPTSRSCLYIPKDLTSGAGQTELNTISTIQSNFVTLLQALENEDYHTVETYFSDSVDNLNFLLKTSPSPNNINIAGIIIDNGMKMSDSLINSNQFSSSSAILSNISRTIPFLASTDASYSNTVTKKLIEKTSSFFTVDLSDDLINYLNSLISSLKDAYQTQFQFIDELQRNKIDPDSTLKLNELGTSTSTMKSALLDLDNGSSLLLQASLEPNKEKKLQLANQTLFIIQQSMTKFPEMNRISSYSIEQSSDEITYQNILSNLPEEQQSRLKELKEQPNSETMPVLKSVFSYSIANEEVTDKQTNITVVKLSIISPAQMDNLTVIEFIPKTQNISISDIQSPYNFTILNEDPVIQFNLGPAALGETKTLTYTISKKLTSYSSQPFAIGSVQLAGIPTLPTPEEIVFSESTFTIRLIAAFLITLFILLEFYLTQKSEAREFKLFSKK